MTYARAAGSLRAGVATGCREGYWQTAIVGGRRSVAAVVGQGALTFDLAVPCEVFGLDRSDIVTPWYEFRLVAADPPPIRTNTGFTIDTPYRLADLAGADTVVVPGWSDPDHRPSAELVDGLRAAHARGARIVALCTGAFVLADAGLLRGRRATTHWMYADRLRARAPGTTVDDRVLYLDDGGVFTSAGTAAGIDLCIHLVRLDYGAEVANTVARRIVMPPFREGGQAQYVEQPVPVVAERSLASLLDWARARLADGVDVAALARRAHLSPRSLRRRFAEALGVAPEEWLRRERLRLAQRLLETTDEPIERIAALAGFPSPAAMRGQFAARLLVSPGGYRRTFRAPGPPTGRA
jgi:transcriptional regulator GlxA family with amidase domain